MDAINETAVNAADDEQQEPLSNYWAHLDGDELGKAVVERWNSYREWLRSNGFLTKWRLQLHYWHNEYRADPANPHLPVMQQFGAQGEYHFVALNHLRSLLKTVLNGVVQNPPTFSPRATNTDADAKEGAALYKPVLDYFVRAQRLRHKLGKLAEVGIAVDQSFIKVEWDFFARKPQDPGSGIWQGDVAVSVHPPWECAYDLTKTAWSDQDWCIVGDWVPQQKVLAQFPEKRDAILAAKKRGEITMGGTADLELESRFRNSNAAEISEDIRILKLFYEDCPWMPKGRFAMFLDDGTHLYTSPDSAGLVYPKIPVERFSADDCVDLLMGYSPINELMGPQEAVNTVLSSIVSNAINFGNQYIAAQQGTDLNPKTLATGQKLLEYPPGAKPPEGINLTAIPESLFAHLKDLMSWMQVIPGVSNVSRGEVPGANSTGAAMLFSASQTTQNAGNLTENWTQTSADVMTLLLHVLRTFGRTQRTIDIMGKNNAARTIVLADVLADFDEVVVDYGNAILNTDQGKIGMAQTMAQMGNLTPQQVLQVATSGNLDAGLDPAREASYAIDKMCEWLLAGEQVIVYATDDHEAQIMAAQRLLNRPEFRNASHAEKIGMTNAPAIVQNIQNFIMENMQHLAGNSVNTAQQQVPGAPQQAGSPGLGTMKTLTPRDTEQVGVDNRAQAAAKRAGTNLPSPPQQPQMRG